MCSMVWACCMPCSHSQASFFCSSEPLLPRSTVSPPSGATTVWPALSVGMGTIPYSWLYFQPLALRSGKIHGPLTIIAARSCVNCWVRSGDWPQFSTDLEAEPSLTMLTHSCRADWNGGVSTLVRLAPALQKNGSSCQVDCSSPVASKATPYTGALVSFLASDCSSAQVAGGWRPASANIFWLENRPTELVPIG